jgi:rSAM/selenodomain-associated transferase 1
MPLRSGSDCPCAIAVMAKASVPGHAKTRLVPPLSLQEAAALNTAFLKDVAANLAAAARGADIRAYMAYGPPGSERFFADTLPPDIRLIEAWFADLGDCLFQTIDRLLADGHGAAVVLNSDSPTVPTSILTEAAVVLARQGDRAVLGPSSDGGYYLLGIKRRHRRLFEGIDWSTNRVARQTRERAQEIGLELHELPQWYDVDDVSALQQLQAELFDGRSFDRALTPHAAPHSAALIGRLLADADLGARLELATNAAAEALP